MDATAQISALSRSELCLAWQHLAQGCLLHEMIENVVNMAIALVRNASNQGCQKLAVCIGEGA